MLVSVEWLRSLCPFNRGPDEVAAALTSRGLTVDAVVPFGDDTALEIDIPANRPDCLGHLGIARELGAAFSVPLTPPRHEVAETGEPVTGQVRVEVRDPDLCTRYTARVVRGVKIGPSPTWVVRRLEACGLRSINNVVDASNLVLLELGNPIHFFDMALLPDATIVVRRARDGETLETLDGVDRKLDGEMLVIADANRPIALAGVIGGADTEIRDRTRDVLIEAAHFAPGSIRTTARRLGIGTDASHRFERGVDPEGVRAAQDLAVGLLAELAGGQPAPGVLDVHPRPRPRATVLLRPERVPRLVGFQPSSEEISSALESMELHSAVESDGSFRVSVPSWRVDLEREADLVEEVARHLGYDRIPSSIGTMRPPASDEPARESLALEERSRDLLAHAGFHEAFNYAMVAADEDTPFVPEATAPAIALSNPIAEPLANLRRSLLPGLLQAADRNLRRGAQKVRLFEVGRVFGAPGADGFPPEPLRAGLAWSGEAFPAHWSGPIRDVALPDVAGVLERLIGSLRPEAELGRSPGGPPGLHPGKSVTWLLPSGEELGWCGALHPEIQAEKDLPRELFLGEIDLDRLGSLPAAIPRHRPLPRVPAVTRDLSLVLDRETTFDRVREVVGKIPPPARPEIDVIDRYEGKPLGADRISLTVRITLHPQDRTLRDEETEAYRTQVVQHLRISWGSRSGASVPGRAEFFLDFPNLLR